MNLFKIKPTKPIAKALVLDPITKKPLNKKGEFKPRNTYWLSRVRDGDVVEIKAKKQTKTPTKEE